MYLSFQIDFMSTKVENVDVRTMQVFPNLITNIVIHYFASFYCIKFNVNNLEIFSSNYLVSTYIAHSYIVTTFVTH